MVLLPILPIQVASVWSTSDLLGSMFIYHLPVETRLLRSFLIHYAEIRLGTL